MDIALNLTVAFGNENHELYQHFKKYQYKIDLEKTARFSNQEFQNIEDWCKEQFGKLREYDAKCRWQVGYVRKHSPGSKTSTFHLRFYFHNEYDAMLFKLAWS